MGTTQMKKLKNPDHFIEKIRELHSPCAKYQHMLDTIADDVEAMFIGSVIGRVNHQNLVKRISKYIRKWRA